MTFSTQEADYVVERAGASISFTGSGIKLVGVTKQPKTTRPAKRTP